MDRLLTLLAAAHTPTWRKATLSDIRFEAEFPVLQRPVEAALRNSDTETDYRLAA